MINYIKGNLFKHTNTNGKLNVLIHACNCKGSWGAGVAAAFKQLYPSTYKKHQQYCHQVAKSSDLLGTCQIIPSEQSDTDANTLVTCLFTSDHFGAQKLSPSEIVRYTELSMNHMIEQLKTVNNLDIKEDKIVVCMPKINAGLFGVPWEQTEQVLKKFTQLHINVYVL